MIGGIGGPDETDGRDTSMPNIKKPSPPSRGRTAPPAAAMGHGRARFIGGADDTARRENQALQARASKSP